MNLKDRLPKSQYYTTNLDNAYGRDLGGASTPPIENEKGGDLVVRRKRQRSLAPTKQQ